MKNEAMYEAEENGAAELSQDTMAEGEDQSNWLLNGCWPLREQEHVVVLTQDSFLIAVVEQCFPNQAEIWFMKSVTMHGNLLSPIGLMMPQLEFRLLRESQSWE